VELGVVGLDEVIEVVTTGMSARSASLIRAPIRRSPRTHWDRPSLSSK
jgi:hypothetical protein